MEKSFVRIKKNRSSTQKFFLKYRKVEKKKRSIGHKNEYEAEEIEVNPTMKRMLRNEYENVEDFAFDCSILK